MVTATHELRVGSQRASLSVREIWDAVSGTCDAHPVDPELAAAVGRVLGLSHNTRPLEILDLGCGTGNPSIHLGLQGHNVTVVDGDADFLASARLRSTTCGAGLKITRENWLDFLPTAIKQGRRYDGVLLLGNALAYQDSWPNRDLPSGKVYDHLIPTFRCLRKLLRPSAPAILEVALEQSTDAYTEYVRYFGASESETGARSLPSVWIITADPERSTRLVDTTVLTPEEDSKSRILGRVGFKGYLLDFSLIEVLAENARLALEEIEDWPREAFRGFLLRSI